MLRPLGFRLLEGDGGTAPAGGDGNPAAAAAAPTTLLGAASPPPATPPASSAPTASAWTKDDTGAFADDWHSRLEGDLKGHNSLKVIGSVGDLAKAYVETKKLVGTKLEAPGDTATPEQVAAWRKVVGAPDKPEGYLGDAKSLRPDGIPEALWDSKNEAAFLAVCHKHSLAPAAVKDIMGHYGGSIAESVAAQAGHAEAHIQGEMATLKKAWGGEFDANLHLAGRVAKTVGLEATHPIFTDAGVVQAFAKLGKMFSETSLVAGDASSSAGGGAASRIQEIQDPKSTATLAREYRGEFGSERQSAAATVLRDLLKAQSDTK